MIGVRTNVKKKSEGVTNARCTCRYAHPCVFVVTLFVFISHTVLHFREQTQTEVKVKVKDKHDRGRHLPTTPTCLEYCAPTTYCIHGLLHWSSNQMPAK